MASILERQRSRPAVDAIFARRSMAIGACAADHPHMQEIMRLVDSDERSLALRVEAALAALGGEPVVSRFTLWYTTRPPVHHAVVRSVSGSRAG